MASDAPLRSAAPPRQMHAGSRGDRHGLPDVNARDGVIYRYVLAAAAPPTSDAFDAMASPTCGEASFPQNLTGLQCLNLIDYSAAASRAACLAACCKQQSAEPPCTTWNFSPDHGDRSCWLGYGDETCVPPTGTWTTWVGGSKPASPPPPGPTPGPPAPVNVDLGSTGPQFYGIGGISGGGATSRLLIDYPEPQRSDILDFMFKPLAGAALSVLKVEIGGGAFTSNGAEASHAYTDEDTASNRFERGYEMWLMREARRRNPDIALYGLPWSWPAWVGGSKGGGGSPWTNLSRPAGYIVDWVRGAKEQHNLTIDWIGDWNETPVQWEYNVRLRAALDAAGFQSVRIAASDQGDGWAAPTTNATQLAVLDAIGAHYPGVHGGPPPRAEFDLLSALSIPMWASEDGADTPFISSTWTRTVNQNFVVLNISSTIAWNLLTAYDADLPYTGRGIMGVANTPWCGAYKPYAAVWASAHTTWFTRGKQGTWKYVGGGHLERGGSWVALRDDASGGVVSDRLYSNKGSPEHRCCSC